MARAQPSHSISGAEKVVVIPLAFPGGVPFSGRILPLWKSYHELREVVARTGSTPTPLGYTGDTGGQTDATTGLIVMGHRVYDPAVGRFLSPDPAYDGTNWYAYCGNNPVNRSDPLGLADPGEEWERIGDVTWGGAFGAIGFLLGGGGGFGGGAAVGGPVGAFVGTPVGAFAGGGAGFAAGVGFNRFLWDLIRGRNPF
ncbi:MAG: RHS repeat-associated core domain-containing protein, partial [Capsulimonadales bacterium]|nr:RHS repeat-associated core domain-containing protein [Capsulimonadales bacterium]